MKLLRRLSAVLAAVCLISAAFAGDPSGTWKWTAPMGGRGGGGGGAGGGGGGGQKGPPRETSLTLAMKDGKLSGSLSSPGRGGGEPVVAQISDASIKDDMVMFSVTRDMGGNSVTTKYSGKLAGDTITGTIEAPGRDGGDPMKRDWTATRAK